ncbi:MAG: aspartate/tyrosine/aromatic aminotransferase [Phycisphaerales bacterium]|nr:aspartate/tyrosine/aromatic aminotransferase [Phycisphaerales bacterium]
MHPSRRVQAVQSPVIPVIGELIRATPGAISLGQGVVSYGPPPQAADRAARYAAGNDHTYKPVQGIAELLSAIRAKHVEEDGFDPTHARAVVVTAGGNMAFMNAILAIADPGDEIILPTPYYFNHEMAIAIASCKAVLVPTDDNYQLRPDALRAAITPRTRAIVTISPNNPTGAVYSPDALRQVNEMCRDAGIYHISDEAYQYFTYDGARSFAPASLPGSAPHTIALYSLSKSYGFASWRIGWMVIPERLLTSVKKIQDTILICPPVVSQHAALGAMEAGRAYCDERIAEIRNVREIVLNELEALGLLATIPRADGAFYFLARVHGDLPPMTIVERLIKEYGVGVLPGDTFGAGGSCLRIAYGALTRETAREGISRLVRGLKGILP